jgi:hypothetical protein
VNIPLEPTRPLVGVASPAPGVDPPQQETPPKQPQRRYIPRALSPQRMWHLIRVITSMTKADPQMVAQGIVPVYRVPNRMFRGIPVGGRIVGFPGSGVFRGKQNIAKSVTYRATYVPGGFNRERDERRKWRAIDALNRSIQNAGN